MKWARWWHGLALALSLFGATAFGNEPAAPASASVPIADILDQADQDQQLVDRMLRRLAQRDSTEALSQSLALLARPVDEKQRTYTAEDLRRLPVMRLESLDRYWAFDERRFQHWQTEAKQNLDALAAEAAQLTRLRLRWEATRSAAGSDLPTALQERVETILAALISAQQALSPALERQVALGQRARALDTRIQSGRDEVTEAIVNIDRRLLRLDAPPLWTLSAARLAAQGELDAIGRGLDIELRFSADYIAASPLNRLVVTAAQVLMLPLLLWAAWRSRRLRAGGIAPDDDPTHVLLRPISAWLLLAMLVTLPFRADAPLLQQEIAMLLAIVPALRLLPAHTLKTLSPWPQVVIALYALNWLCVLVMDSGFLYRVLQLGLAVISLVLLLCLLRAEQRRSATNAARLPIAVLWLGWLAAALLAAGAVAHLFGNITLGEMLINGVADVSYLGLLLHTSVTILIAVLRLLPGLPLGTPLRLPHAYAARLLLIMERALRLITLLGWMVYTTDAFRLLRPIQALLERIVTHHFELGEISISLGDLLVLAVSVLIAYWTARIVRSLLRDRLSEKASLPRGAGNSIASLSYYALLLLGFVLALSAAGFQVSQLALVFGALGVGIGFGLQSLVGNFVSGLVLMFERPIQPGDVIEIGDATGRVREIGLRATVLRTFDGADVVVPNGTLLSGNLRNWTLFDRSRRIEVQVGVAYGSDVDRVLALLRAAGRDTPGVVEEPAPLAFMTGLGESSLEFVLRVWTHDFDGWVTIRGELLVRVLAALTEAGIRIPFRQVDVHLQAVSAPEVPPIQ